MLGHTAGCAASAFDVVRSRNVTWMFCPIGCHASVCLTTCRSAANAKVAVKRNTAARSRGRQPAASRHQPTSARTGVAFGCCNGRLGSSHFVKEGSPVRRAIRLADVEERLVRIGYLSDDKPKPPRGPAIVVGSPTLVDPDRSSFGALSLPNIVSRNSKSDTFFGTCRQRWSGWRPMRTGQRRQKRGRGDHGYLQRRCHRCLPNSYSPQSDNPWPLQSRGHPGSPRPRDFASLRRRTSLDNPIRAATRAAWGSGWGRGPSQPG
jgi:hypothetical protein